MHISRFDPETKGLSTGERQTEYGGEDNTRVSAVLETQIEKLIAEFSDKYSLTCCKMLAFILIINKSIFNNYKSL